MATTGIKMSDIADMISIKCASFNSFGKFIPAIPMEREYEMGLLHLLTVNKIFCLTHFQPIFHFHFP